MFRLFERIQFCSLNNCAVQTIMTELKQIRCRAAVQHEATEPLMIETVLIDVPRADQVRIKMVSAGICASDASIVWGNKSLSQLGQSHPCVFGHEGAGIVESVGDEITTLASGDYVLTTFMPACGDCIFCSNTQTNMCAKENVFKLGAVANKKLLDGTAVQGMSGLGVYSEYVLPRKCQVVKIEIEREKLENACVISCAVVTGFYAANVQAKVAAGSTAAIWGMGAVGLNAAFGCKHAGAKNIIGIDINEDKRAIAQQFGCTEFVNALDLDNKPVEQYLKEKYPLGVDFAFDCIGNQAVIDTALKSLSICGKLSLVGICPRGTKIEYTAADLILGRSVTGALMGGARASESYPALTKMYRDGKYDIDRLVSNRFKLDQINEAFDTLKSGKCVRSLIIFD